MLPTGIICQVCDKRPATCHIDEVQDDGTVLELHICHSCLANLGVGPHDELPSIADLLAGTPRVPDPEDAPATDGLVCPVCGMTWETFSKHNRFGCEHDVAVFAPRLLPHLLEMHGAVSHVGRLPRAIDDSRRLREMQRLALAQDLRQAVLREDYTEAARLRDELRGLEEP